MRSVVAICVVFVALMVKVVSGAEESSSAVMMDDGSQNLPYPMVYVEVKLIQVPEKEIAEIAAKLKKPAASRIVDSSFVPAILESKSLEVIAGGAVLSQNGQQAVVRMIMDKYLPTSLNEAQSIRTGIGSGSAVKDDAQKGKTKDKATTGGKAFHCGSSPQFGEPTPLGFQLIVTPVADADHHTIDLNLEPVLLLHAGDTVYDGLKMPEIKAVTTQTTMGVFDGETLVVGTAITSGKDNHAATQSRTLLLLTARLVKTDGMPYNSNGDVKANVPVNTAAQSENTATQTTVGAILPLVQVATLFLEISSKNLAKLTGGKEQFGLPDQDLIQKLLSSEDAKILSLMQGIGTSGSPVLVRRVVEAYYPDNWTAPQAKVTDLGDSYTPAYPQCGEARDIGERLCFTPTVSPDNKTITVEMRPELTAFGGWTEYPCRDAINVPHAQTMIKMAEIKRKDVTTNVNIQNGATIPVAKMQCEYENGSLTEATSDRIVFVFLSVLLVGHDGKEVKDKIK